MRDDRNYSSASMDNYIRWVMKDKLYLTDKECKSYFRLCMDLAGIEFIWSHPLDENRAIDGLELRSDFEYETGDYLDKTSGLMPKCTVFEMLAGLAIRCENQLMYSPSMGNRTSKWFFEFLDNLNLDHNSKINRKIAEDILDGNTFPLKNSRNGIKREQIWKQLGAYLNENYAHDASDLELFK